jgi:ribonuclease HI
MEQLSFHFWNKQYAERPVDSRGNEEEWRGRMNETSHVGQKTGKRRRDRAEALEAKKMNKKKRIKERAADVIPDGVNMWIDGSCLGQGARNTASSRVRAGIGIWFADGDVRNVSMPLPGTIQTNNRAECFALVVALKLVLVGARHTIWTDSTWVLKIYEDIDGHMRRGWKNRRGSELHHMDLWIQIYEEYRRRGSVVDLKHVYGHTNQEGNTKADKLAKEGAEMYVAPNQGILGERMPVIGRQIRARSSERPSDGRERGAKRRRDT